MSINKKIKYILSPKSQHWVGDGFYVYPSIRPEEDTYFYTTPFILMDYAAPKVFPAGNKRRGIGEHPHRGFETVTFAMQGEVEHRDSSGGGGVIRAGDVQWMTAGSGVVHDEFHSQSFTKEGGVFEMVQLWVNLPASKKMTEAHYQEVKGQDMPSVEHEGYLIKVVAGEYKNKKGPASTFSPMNIYQLEAKSDTAINFDFVGGTTTLLLVLSGELSIDGQTISEHSTVVFTREGSGLSLETLSEAKLLILNAEPIDEPIVSYGPFVMNTQEEIEQAFADFRAGKMGTL